MKTHPIFLLLIISLSSCESCKRHKYEYQPDIQWGGRIVALSRSPANNSDIVAGAETGGIFLSKKGGTAWEHVEMPVFEIVDVEYASTDANILICTSLRDLKVNNGGGIWRSKDGGKNWYKPSTSVYKENGKDKPTHGFGIAFEPASNRVYVGLEYGIAISNNNGDTWSFNSVDTKFSLGGISKPKVYSIVAAGSNRAIAATSFGIYYTTDGGATWQKSATDVPDMANVRGLALAPVNSNHCFFATANYAIYASVDFGKNWTEIKSPGGGNREPFIRCGRAKEGDERNLMLYYGNGVDLWRKEVVINNDGSPNYSKGWTKLSLEHSDPSDLIFAADKITPKLLSGDGGVFNTNDNGKTWKVVGGGNGCLNALQITEVTAQDNFDSKKDRIQHVYFGTQDNWVWASNDGAKTWNMWSGGEGFSIQTKRISLLPKGNLMSFVSCADCSWRVSEQNLQSENAWKTVGGAVTDPVLWPTDPLDPNPPDRFLQISKGAANADGSSTKYFNRTYNAGSSWSTIGSMPYDPMSQLAQISQPAGGAVIYQSVAQSGTTKQGLSKIGLVRLSTMGSVLERADLNGFGSLGIFPTMFKWYNVFAVNPNDANHLIIADVENEKMKVSWDGGRNWFNDDELTDYVTSNGQFKMYQRIDGGPKLLVTCISFNPLDPGQIAVGTRENGIFYTWDKGNTWQKLVDTDRIVNISSIFFYFDNTLLVSSYGRGLWKFEPKKSGENPGVRRDFKRKGAFFVDLRTQSVQRLQTLDSLKRFKEYQLITLQQGKEQSLGNFLKNKQRRFTVDARAIYKEHKRISDNKPVNLINDFNEAVNQYREYTSLPIRVLLTDSDYHLQGLIISQDSYEIYSQEELAVGALTTPYISLRNSNFNNPFAITKGKPLEINGYNFTPAQPGKKNTVSVFIDDVPYGGPITVNEKGAFSIRIVLDESPRDGVTILAKQQNGNVLETV